MTPTQSSPISDDEMTDDEAFAQDLRELQLWLGGAESIGGGQGWQVRTLNFFWMDKFRSVAKEAYRRHVNASVSAPDSPL